MDDSRTPVDDTRIRMDDTRTPADDTTASPVLAVSSG
jgi:hypothetical protein